MFCLRWDTNVYQNTVNNGDFISPFTRLSTLDVLFAPESYYENELLQIYSYDIFPVN